MTERERNALVESHKLLKHYAVQLNVYDGGERKIPDDLEEWIDRCNKLKVKTGDD